MENLRKFIQKILEEAFNSSAHTIMRNDPPMPLSDKVYNQQEMVAMGGNYNCYHGMLMMIPVNKIDGLDPTLGNWTDDKGIAKKFKKGGNSSNKPIEVWYDNVNNVYTLYDGNHRVTQAKLNGDKYIKAFVQADSKEIYQQWKQLFNKKSPKKLKENLIDEEYPSNFNMEEFKKLKSFKQRIDYCGARLKRISSGSARIVYQIDNTKVLKLAKNAKGLAQNESEAGKGNDSYFGTILAKVFDYDQNDLWIEMELARKTSLSEIKKLTGFDLNIIYEFLDNVHNQNNGREPTYNLPKEITQELWENEFTTTLVDFVENYNMTIGDFRTPSSFGVVNREGHETLVLIDYGLTEDVFATHYSRRVAENKTISESSISEEEKECKILFLHGLDGNPDEKLISSISKFGMVDAPKINYQPGKNIFEQFLSIVQANKYDLIIGHSIGGLLAYYLCEFTGSKGLLLMPSFGDKNDDDILGVEGEFGKTPDIIAIVSLDDKVVDNISTYNFIPDSKIINLKNWSLDEGHGLSPKLLTKVLNLIFYSSN